MIRSSPFPRGVTACQSLSPFKSTNVPGSMGIRVSLISSVSPCVRKHGETEEIRETRIPMDPGTFVLLKGDKLWHAVTPLGKGEERIILTLQYVTNQEMGPFKKMFS